MCYKCSCLSFVSVFFWLIKWSIMMMRWFSLEACLRTSGNQHGTDTLPTMKPFRIQKGSNRGSERPQNQMLSAYWDPSIKKHPQGHDISSNTHINRSCLWIHSFFNWFISSFILTCLHKMIQNIHVLYSQCYLKEHLSIKGNNLTAREMQAICEISTVYKIYRAAFS